MSETDETFDQTLTTYIPVKTLAKYVTCAISRFTFATFICNNYNIPLKHLIGEWKTGADRFRSLVWDVAARGGM
jgi:hypothetical protein